VPSGTTQSSPRTTSPRGSERGGLVSRNFNLPEGLSGRGRHSSL
jgi:hypothetical protein